MTSSDGSASDLNEEPCEKRSVLLVDDPDLFKGNHLPVARVKKIMKEGEHHGMISSDAPVILAKACEMLVRDLTLQSWDYTQMTKRCTLQDITCAIFKSNVYNFLYDLLTPSDLKPVMEAPQPGGVRNSSLSDSLLNPHLAFDKVTENLSYPTEDGGQFDQTHPYADSGGSFSFQTPLEDDDSGECQDVQGPEVHNLWVNEDMYMWSHEDEQE